MRYRPSAQAFTAWLVLAVFTVLVARSVEIDKGHQWDFYTYYYAGVTANAGGDPYDRADVSRAAGFAISLPYVYPPYTLFAAKALARMPFETAFHAFVTVKACAFLVLAALWLATMRTGAERLLLLLTAAAGYNGTVFVDIVAGNISIFEQVVLWTGFHFLARGRAALFTACVVAAALPKLTPLWFLVVLLPGARRDRLACFGTGIAAFTAFQVLAAATAPDSYGDFLRNIGGSDNRGWTNPSALAFLRDIATAFHLPSAAGSLAFLLFAVAVLGVTAERFWRKGSAYVSSVWCAVGLACAAYAIMMPRMTYYMQVVMIAPTVWILLRSTSVPKFIVLALFFYVAVLHATVPVLDRVVPLLANYGTLFCSVLVWVLYLAHQAKDVPLTPEKAPEA
jgi:hypothetical protein